MEGASGIEHAYEVINTLQQPGGHVKHDLRTTFYFVHAAVVACTTSSCIGRQLRMTSRFIAWNA